MTLPGVCIVCQRPLVWNGHYWRDLSATRGRHECAADRAVCGKWMPSARERCARRPGHRTECRTRYALDNALQMATGRRVA